MSTSVLTVMSLLVSFLTQVQRYDPTYEATRLHFEDLARRYGNPIIILNLIKVCAKTNLWPPENLHCVCF